MSRCWLAFSDAAPDGADACARTFTADGDPAGWLAAWHQRAKPARGALRVDERLVDPDGEPAWISLVLPRLGVRLPFDDLAVQQARRAVLAAPAPAGVSTLLRDDSHFEGAITVARSAAARRRLLDDPFARIFPQRLLGVDAGVLGAMPAPVGPTIERYGSANPWPSDTFL
jgi:hypothetical protein